MNNQIQKFISLFVDGSIYPMWNAANFMRLSNCSAGPVRRQIHINISWNVYYCVRTFVCSNKFDIPKFHHRVEMSDDEIIEEVIYLAIFFRKSKHQFLSISFRFVHRFQFTFQKRLPITYMFCNIQQKNPMKRQTMLWYWKVMWSP